MTFVDQLTDNDLLRGIWAALRRLEQALPLTPVLPVMPAPVVTVLPPDLTDVVEAVNQLKPGVDADQIAAALARVLAPGVPQPLPGVEEFTVAVKELSWRLKGVGAQAYGGGSVSLQPNQTISIGNLPADQLVHAANLDLAITALRDALRGASSKTLTDVVAALAATLTVAGTVTVANPTAGPNADQLIHGTVTANLGTVDGVALDATLAPISHRFSPSLATGYPAVNPVSTSGDTVVYTPAAGKAIRLKWLYLSTLDSNTANVVAKVRFSTQTLAQSFYTVPLGKPGGFAHGTLRESVVDATLIVNLSVAQPVYLSLDLEDF